MLAKQVLRLLNNPSSLTAHVLQAKYFPWVSILEAPLGYRPSHAWRSIREGISLLSLGLEWRVGNGQNINIWHDRWLPESELGHPKYIFPGSDAIMLVSDLFTETGYEWDQLRLRILFHEDHVHKISMIQVSPRLRPDTIRWRYSENGIYSVRQGYHVDYEAWWHAHNMQSTSDPNSFKWSKVWHLECPPRIQNFLWRAIDNNLPVRENLHR